MKKTNQYNLTLSAVFLALGMVLPLLTAQIKEIGDSLLPMHLPVMLCGLLCGPWQGLAVGLILPFLRSAFFGMPPIYPNAVWMALELATYGFTIGLFYTRQKKKNLAGLYLSLIAAMLCGRLVWGAAKAILLGLSGKAFPLIGFWTGGFLDALPGIALQLILIPAIMGIIHRKSGLTQKGE